MSARLIGYLAGLLLPGVWLATAHAESPAELVFERDIRPILRAHCLDCHGAEDDKKGQLDLRLVRFQVKGGESGPAIVPGQPADSLLIQRIRSGDMPPGPKKVTPAELSALERWIAAGAKSARPEPETIAPGLGITPEERRWWAFQPIQRPEPPAVQHADQVRTPIDAFLLQRLEVHGLGFNPVADRATLIRRAYFDLLGLPPTAEQIDAFVQDSDPAAWERLVETLLDSPHYGERWGRHWLDVAGYADSEGMTQDDRVRPQAYKYRDYVIRSFQQDKPFDRFLVEQLAGDELIAPPYANLTPEQIEKLVATGFLRMAADGTAGGVDQDLARNQVVSDTIKILSTSLLGLSVGCAQCHDHRYDPIPQADYYALRSVLEPALNWKTWRNPDQRQVSLYTDTDRAKAAEVEAEVQTVAQERSQKQTQFLAEALEKELEKHPAELRDALRTVAQSTEKDRTPEQKALLKERPSVNITPGVLYQYNQAAADELKKLDEQIAGIRKKKPVEDFVRALTEVPGQAPVAMLFHRGDYRQPTREIPPGDLQIATLEGETVAIPVDDPVLPTTGRRLAYAQWLTSGRHPLVARVLVNRFWLHHFGRGIVGTPADFGRLGELPTHPELLDWLADEFIARGWSLKTFHRMVMTSTAYRQSAHRRSEQDAVDADNLLIGRMAIRRLDAETIRDRMLAVTGTLNRDQFGPPVNVTADDTGQVIVEGETPRRSIYIQQRRSQPVSFLTTFDAPVMETNCERRTSSTVAGQALLLMNNSFVVGQSEKLADRIVRESGSRSVPDLPAELLARLSPPPVVWSYGSGRYDEVLARVVALRPFGVFEQGRWQGGAMLPSPETGWAMLHAAGGHTGENPDFAAIRRWTAPKSGTVTITGQLEHPGGAGDGVRGRIVSSRSGLAGEWVATTSKADTRVTKLPVEPGDTIDFVTDCRTSVTTDSFGWSVRLTLESGPVPWNSDSVADFAGPQPSVPALAPAIGLAWRLAYGREPVAAETKLAAEFLGGQLDVLKAAVGADGKPLTPVAQQRQALANLCQQLLASNEFLYVD
jgi:hypothetical protein